jgi:hypothetical protein
MRPKNYIKCKVKKHKGGLLVTFPDHPGEQFWAKPGKGVEDMVDYFLYYRWPEQRTKKFVTPSRITHCDDRFLEQAKCQRENNMFCHPYAKSPPETMPEFMNFTKE